MAQVVDKRVEYNKIMRRLRALSGKSVDSGLLPEAGTHERSGKHYAEIMFANEYGEQDVPSRPLFRITFDGNIPTFKSAIRKSTDNYVAGRQTVAKFLKNVGELHVDLLKDTIDNRVFEPNAEATINRKGFNFPLVETQTMYNSFSYRINF